MLLRNIALCMATLLNVNGNAFSCLKLYLNDKTSSAYQQSYELHLTTALLIAGYLSPECTKRIFIFHKSMVLRIPTFLLLPHIHIHCKKECSSLFQYLLHASLFGEGGGLYVEEM